MFADHSGGECVVEWIKLHDRRHAFAVMSLSTGEHYTAAARILDRRFVKADQQADAIRCAPSHGYQWGKLIDPAGIAKHYFAPALAALGLGHVRWHDLRHAFAVMSLSAGEHYMAVSKMLGHASFVTTLTVYADYITEGDGGKNAPLRRADLWWVWCERDFDE